MDEKTPETPVVLIKGPQADEDWEAFKRRAWTQLKEGLLDPYREAQAAKEKKDE